MNLDWVENFNLVGIGEVRKVDQLVADEKVDEDFAKMESSPHLHYCKSLS
jgi:hypothetical protein